MATVNLNLKREVVIAGIGAPDTTDPNGWTAQQIADRVMTLPSHTPYGHRTAGHVFVADFQNADGVAKDAAATVDVTFWWRHPTTRNWHSIDPETALCRRSKIVRDIPPEAEFVTQLGTPAGVVDATKIVLTYKAIGEG